MTKSKTLSFIALILMVLRNSMWLTTILSDVKKITCLTIQLTVGFLSPDNGGTEGGVKTIEYFMYVRPWFRVPVYVCPSVDYRLIFSSSFLLVFIKTRQLIF